MLYESSFQIFNIYSISYQNLLHLLGVRDDVNQMWILKNAKDKNQYTE
jgi:hypothetical protein